VFDKDSWKRKTIAAELPLREAPGFTPMGKTRDDKQLYWLGHRFSSPPDLPIFKEVDPSVGHLLFLTIAHPAALLSGTDRIFQCETCVQTPGFIGIRKWIVRLRGAFLDIRQIDSD
jgi:hypothetical protein